VDFKDERYTQVKAILVDPSCSGSGTISFIKMLIFYKLFLYWY